MQRHMHLCHGHSHRGLHTSSALCGRAESRAQRALTRAKASLPTAGLPIVTTLTSAAGHCSAAHTPHSVACARCSQATRSSVICMQSWLQHARHLAVSLSCLQSGARQGAGLRDSSICTVPQGLQAADEGVSCMRVLTRPAPRLWPEQYTLVGGVPPLMPSTTLLRPQSCPFQSDWSNPCFSMISIHMRICSACPKRPQAYNEPHVHCSAMREVRLRVWKGGWRTSH